MSKCALCWKNPTTQTYCAPCRIWLAWLKESPRG